MVGFSLDDVEVGEWNPEDSIGYNRGGQQTLCVSNIFGIVADTVCKHL